MSADSPFQDAAKRVIGDFLRSKAPQPKGNEETVCITPEGVLRQIEAAIAHGKDPDEPIRLALLLAAIMASQRGWTKMDALLQAGIAWAQTEGLRKT